MLASSHEALRDTQAYRAFSRAHAPARYLAPSRTDGIDPCSHPKVNTIAEWVAARLAAGYHVLVFCVFVKTQTALRAAIAQCTGDETSVDAPLTAARARKMHRDRFGRPPDAGETPLALVVRDNLSGSDSPRRRRAVHRPPRPVLERGTP